MTPLQGAMIAATVANNGSQMRPYLVQQLKAADLTTVHYTAQPKELRRSVSGEQARDLQTMMISVVENGSGKNARITGFQVGGKTGTAENADRGRVARLVHRVRDEGQRAGHRHRRVPGERRQGRQRRGGADRRPDHEGVHRREGPGVMNGRTQADGDTC